MGIKVSKWRCRDTVCRDKGVSSDVHSGKNGKPTPGGPIGGGTIVSRGIGVGRKPLPHLKPRGCGPHYPKGGGRNGRVIIRCKANITRDPHDGGGNDPTDV